MSAVLIELPRLPSASAMVSVPSATLQLVELTMKTLARTLIATLVLGLILSAFSAERRSTSATKLRHVVAFKFKQSATGEQIKQVEDAFRDLKKNIQEIQNYEWGTNVS